jgi:hypothetical protein
MADDKDKPSVLENKDEFKQDDKASSGNDGAQAREEMGQMAEKTEVPGGSGSTQGDKA